MSGRLLIIYDPEGRVEGFRTDAAPPEVKQAMLDITDDLEGRDIYEIARKIAELLLEQL